ncbi:g9731 [Coccomyxa viridis]|uniref:G9731 protein n=1 Tax=Coccomyxa viridis TaxID=1274662 RepID=A0ABP1G3U1_9CHLO
MQQKRAKRGNSAQKPKAAAALAAAVTWYGVLINPRQVIGSQRSSDSHWQIWSMQVGWDILPSRMTSRSRPTC